MYEASSEGRARPSTAPSGATDQAASSAAIAGSVDDQWNSWPLALSPARRSGECRAAVASR